MSDSYKPTDDVIVECEVCMKEIPTSEARSEEASDYVLHFCGLECYEKWQTQPPKKND